MPISLAIEALKAKDKDGNFVNGIAIPINLSSELDKIRNNQFDYTAVREAYWSVIGGMIAMEEDGGNKLREGLLNFLDEETVQKILDGEVEEEKFNQLVYGGLWDYLKQVAEPQMYELEIPPELTTVIPQNFIGQFIENLQFEGMDMPTFLGEAFMMYGCIPALFLKRVNINEGVTSIKGFAFGCAYFCEDYSLPESIEELCSEEELLLTPPTPPFESVEDLYKYLFIMETSGQFFANMSLTNVGFAKNLKIISALAFAECISLKVVELPLAQQLGNSCFYGCSSATSFELPLAQQLGDSCFYGCSSATSFELPLAQQLGDSCFNGCSSATSFELPLAQQLGNSCFNSCSNLVKVILGKEVVKIAYFGYNMSKFNTLVIHTVEPPVLTGSSNIPINTGLKIYVPAESVNKYKQATNWSGYASYIEAMPEEYKWEGE